MDHKKIIKNLLDRAGNTHSEHEAQASLLKAQELMMKYDIDEADAVASGGVKITTEEIIVDIGYTKVPLWVWSLTEVIAGNFRCYSWKTLKVHGKDRYGFLKWSYQPCMMGTEADVAVAAEALRFAVASAKALWKRTKVRIDAENLKFYGYKVANTAGDRNEYFMAFSEGLKVRYSQQVSERALIIVKPEQVIEHFEGKKFTKGATSTAQRSYNRTAREAGYNDGLHHAAGSIA